MQLGLKASTNKAQIDDRLQYHPDVFEFHLEDSDFTEAGWQHFIQMVAYVSDYVPHIVFHHPMKWHGQRCELFTNEAVNPALHDFIIQSSEKIIKLAADVDGQALVHGAYKRIMPKILRHWSSVEQAQEVVFARMARFTDIAPDHVVFENGISPVYGYGDAEFEQRIIDAALPLACDVSHTFISVHGDNDALVASLKHLKSQIKHYHLVDSMGQKHDSLTVGTGLIDWSRVVPELNAKATTIYEINLADQLNCREMIASHQYLQNIVK